MYLQAVVKERNTDQSILRCEEIFCHIQPHRTVLPLRKSFPKPGTCFLSPLGLASSNSPFREKLRCHLLYKKPVLVLPSCPFLSISSGCFTVSFSMLLEHFLLNLYHRTYHITNCPFFLDFLAATIV